MEKSRFQTSDTADEAGLKYRMVNLQDLPIKITNFAETRNRILEQLDDDEYVLWTSEDEEPSQMLLAHLNHARAIYPYYAVRRINLVNGRFYESANPEYSPHLVSNRVRYKGAIHETVMPRKPMGRIDYPIIHNHSLDWKYSSGWKQTRAYRPVLALKKGYQALTGR